MPLGSVYMCLLALGSLREKQHEDAYLDPPKECQIMAQHLRKQPRRPFCYILLGSRYFSTFLHSVLHSLRCSPFGLGGGGR